MFDWLMFLERHRIEYVSSGANVAKNNVNISCPFCGSADSSHHLGIHLDGKGWGCWRSADHRGGKPHRLIQALIGCSYQEASAIAGDSSFPTELDSVFGDQIGAMFGSNEEMKEKSKSSLKFPPDFRPLSKATPNSCFTRYMVSRGYCHADMPVLSECYGLQYSVSGKFKDRIVFPVYMENGLVTWTGRAISPKAFVRYRALSANPQKAKEDDLPCATISIDKTLFNYKELQDGGSTIVVTEGPFDALRIDFLGYERDIRSTCLFNKNMSPEQIDLLFELKNRFKRRIVLLDRDAALDSISLQGKAEHLGFEIRFVPDHRKDPAEMTQREVDALYLPR